ncbi:MAG TPA: hypothetical protein VLF91_06710 [Candidatus Saccharimonadales bacterium]|nr:hypothetical protein [Candidatus Saccharimonadales bacterium]
MSHNTDSFDIGGHEPLRISREAEEEGYITSASHRPEAVAEDLRTALAMFLSAYDAADYADRRGTIRIGTFDGQEGTLRDITAEPEAASVSSGRTLNPFSALKRWLSGDRANSSVRTQHIISLEEDDGALAVTIARNKLATAIRASQSGRLPSGKKAFRRLYGGELYAAAQRATDFLHDGLPYSPQGYAETHALQVIEGSEAIEVQRTLETVLTTGNGLERAVLGHKGTAEQEFTILPESEPFGESALWPVRGVDILLRCDPPHLIDGYPEARSIISTILFASDVSQTINGAGLDSSLVMIIEGVYAPDTATLLNAQITYATENNTAKVAPTPKERKRIHRAIAEQLSPSSEKEV